ncbi:cysteine-rich repeat secretory protein 38-like [Mangifera indica]|uniref:cysteine-rich repeat secretory protein 38-like n=1 Tax=Mangifera indica TaxID=29780 RepID=UPI001CFBB094|nr:cysteine-rich repeat secretory protein 38-like [Mangifera indica]
MASLKLLFVWCSIVIYLCSLTFAQGDRLNTICLYDKGNFTANSSYKANLKHLLSSLTSNNKIDYGFYNASYGKGTAKVNAMALCRGDVQPDNCRSCIKNSSSELTESCPNQKEAVIWYDDCMLRYSNRSFFGNMEFGPYFSMYNLNNVTEVNQFHEVLRNLLNNLTKEAASGDSLRKFATGNSTTASSQHIYALTQCTPDLSEKQCVDCLNNATSLLPQCCDRSIGGRVISPSCNFRYEQNIFYDSTVHAVTPSPSPSPSPSSPTPSSSEAPSPQSLSPSPQSLSPTPPPPSEDDSKSPSPSPPPGPTNPAAPEEDTKSPQPPPAPTNSAPSTGKQIAVPLLLLQYLLSTSGIFF